MTARITLRQKIGEINKDTLARHAQYIAGLLDGEGTFTIRWNRSARSPNFQPLIMVAMTHKGVIKYLAETLKVTYETKERINQRTYYLLRVTTKDDIVMILNALMPYLKVKKEHAKIILELIDLKARPYTRENVTRMTELYLKIRQLNPKGSPFDPDKLKSDLDQYIENCFK